ncbi:DUF397 domain-containing protein [Streptomyces nondiastaticus]|uniref:DUF397 domain-containing protein n=1 Tax=Streptomyces nondiastaticus TaxID=3154512 RepID=UPI0034468BC3
MLRTNSPNTVIAGAWWRVPHSVHRRHGTSFTGSRVNCEELKVRTTTWQKSTYSGNGDNNDCVEVAATGGTIVLRESDTPRTVVRTTPPALGSLIRALKAGADCG